MSSQDIDSGKFFAVVDQFIDLANQHLAAEPDALGAVSAAITYAAARFNAHEAMLRIEDLDANRGDTVEWFIERYRLMLTDNVDEHLVMKALSPSTVD